MAASTALPPAFRISLLTWAEWVSGMAIAAWALALVRSTAVGAWGASGAQPMSRAAVRIIGTSRCVRLGIMSPCWCNRLRADAGLARRFEQRIHRLDMRREGLQAGGRTRHFLGHLLVLLLLDGLPHRR